ncbi:hypothetical protein TNCV_1115831 [Trichonephila clavipes]|nr:hypothetical protein TNCV_1115831 [Trichonephila clavipes]
MEYSWIKARTEVIRTVAVYLGYSGRKKKPRADPFIAAVTVSEKMPGNDEDVHVEEQTPKISHREGLKAVETALRCFEQGMSVIDLLLLGHLRDEAEKRGVKYGRKK